MADSRARIESTATVDSRTITLVRNALLSCASDRRWGGLRGGVACGEAGGRVATSRTSPSRATSPILALGASGAPDTGWSKCRPSALLASPKAAPAKALRTACAVLRFGSLTLSVPLRSLLLRYTVNLLLVFGLGGEVVAVGAAAVAAMPVRGRPRGDSDDCPGCLRTVTAANRLPLVFLPRGARENCNKTGFTARGQIVLTSARKFEVTNNRQVYSLGPPDEARPRRRRRGGRREQPARAAAAQRAVPRRHDRAAAAGDRL